MRRLLLLASSFRRTKEPKEPIPALDRYTGVYFRIVKKYIREKKMKDTDLLIVSEDFGILRPTDLVPYLEPFRGSLTNKIGLESITELRKRNLDFLKNSFREKQYSEIFINVGKGHVQLIDGLDKITPARIIFASGSSLGKKAQHLKSWILRSCE